MELRRGSLYKAFRDKHSLFERALEDYLRASRAAMTRILESEAPPIARLQAWLAQEVADCSGAEGGLGLAVNTIVEVAPGCRSARSIGAALEGG